MSLLPSTSLTLSSRRSTRPLDRRRCSATTLLALACGAALLVACSKDPVPPGAASESTGGKSGRGGSGGNSSATGGSGGSPTATGGSGGAVTTGGASGTGGSGTGGSTGGAPGTGGAGDAGPTTDSSVDATAPNTSEVAPADTAAGACGMTGQICCAANTCLVGAPQMTVGPEGTTVLELKASGGNPYQLFAMKNLLPIDGPSSGYITDTGSSFLFVLHENGAEETVSSGAQRQRNEVTVNPPNPAIYKGMRNDVMSYTWRFKLDVMNSNPTWCDIFQIKQHGPLGVAPYMAFEADKGQLKVDTEKMGIIRSIPLSTIMGTWINASVTIKYADQGSLAFTLKKDDGTVVMSYANDNFDMWDTTVDFVRPKWGFYRNKRAGAGEAAIHYNDMKIIRGGLGSSCTCR